MNEKSRIAIIGSGSWATALVKLFLNNVESLNWFILEPEIRENVQEFHHNPRYLSSVVFDINKLKLHDNIVDAI